jgi:glycosyltransferase involved in cell wall biosynthesis
VKKPLISVALCTYNGEKYIKEQLDSIINQTYKNLEIIVVDDCSTDDTWAIVSAYAQKDKRIKSFKNDVNLGFNKNFEKAISLTTGDYIALSDQDDIWLPDKISQLAAGIKNYWLVFSNSSYIGDTGRKKLLRRFHLPLNYRGILLRNYVTGHTSLFRREFLSFALPLPDDGYYDWWLGFVASYHHKICFLDKVLTLYRVHETSVIQSRLGLGEVKLQEYENTVAMLSAFVSYKNLQPEDRQFIVDLKVAYQLRRSQLSSIQLAKIISKYYSELFPNRPYWKVFKKHSFARKFSKGLS